MSQQRTKRRQFLADMLFAGGALGAAALAARYLGGETATPEPVAVQPSEPCATREDLVNARGGRLMVPPPRPVAESR